MSDKCCNSLTLLAGYQKRANLCNLFQKFLFQFFYRRDINFLQDIPVRDFWSPLWHFPYNCQTPDFSKFSREAVTLQQTVQNKQRWKLQVSISLEAVTYLLTYSWNGQPTKCLLSLSRQFVVVPRGDIGFFSRTDGRKISQGRQILEVGGMLMHTSLHRWADRLNTMNDYK